jgi:hypothetical protein
MSVISNLTGREFYDIIMNLCILQTVYILYQQSNLGCIIPLHPLFRNLLMYGFRTVLEMKRNSLSNSTVMIK